MPSGYQDRLSDTYWTGSNLTWNGVKWSSNTAVKNVELTPTGSMDPDVDELRVRAKIPGAKFIHIYDGSAYVRTIAVNGDSNQILTIRTRSALSMSFKLTFDNTPTVEITEIEAGYNGAHF